MSDYPTNAEKLAEIRAAFAPTSDERHVDEVPQAWFERSPRNTWYSRELRKVVLPRTIKHRNNFVLTMEEHKQYLQVLTEMRAEIEKEHAAVRTIVLAMDRGKDDPFRYGHPGYPRTICHCLELMVTVAKSKLAAMNFFNDICKARKLGSTE